MAEAASFVLAALPLIIEGLRAYAEGIVTIKKWWRYRTLLQHIVRRLELEQVKLYNTCTNLLQDLVDDNMLHLLLENPGGFRWREESLRMSLRLRLGKSFHVFLNTMNDMKEIVELLKAKLDLDTDNKPRWADYRVHKREWKRIRLVLQEEAVETLLKRLREDNKDLVDLLEYTRPVETMKVPDTTANAKGYERIRNNAKDLYQLLKHSFTWPCGCMIPHNASVHLQYRTCRELVVVSTESKPPFDVLFFFETDQSTATAIPPWVWRETIIEPLEIPSCESRHMSHEESPQIEAMTSFAASATTNTRSSAIVATTGFSLSAVGGSTALNCFDAGHGQGNNIGQAAKPGGSSSQVTTSRLKNSPLVSTPGVTLRSEAYSSQVSPSRAPSERIESLCRAMLDPLNLPYLGIIVDGHEKQHRISITKASHSTDILRTVSLKSLLAQGLPEKKDRLILGVKLTSSLLQLHNTPWLAESWGSPDVLFMTKDDNPLLDKPWFSRHFPSPTCTILPRQSTGQPLCAEVRNQSMFALGVVLIELWFGKTLENLREMIDLGPRGEVNAITEFATTRRLSEAIYNEAGEWYGDAVRRCIYCDLNQRYTSLDRETLKEAVHRGVVLPLESHLSLFCGGKVSDFDVIWKIINTTKTIGGHLYRVKMVKFCVLRPSLHSNLEHGGD